MFMKLAPDDNGLNLTRTIKSSHADNTVIIITAYGLPEYRQATFEAGASQFISKSSLSEDEVLTLVESVMREAASRKSHQSLYSRPLCYYRKV
jgi:DNA-binding NarL/FixJ family response regulator